MTSTAVFARSLITRSTRYRRCWPSTVVGWVLFGLVGLCRMPGLAEVVPLKAAPPVAATVETLLARTPPSQPKQARQHLTYLWAHRAVWKPQRLNQLIIYRRLALLYGQVARPDSSYACLLQARRAAEPLRPVYPLETADVFFDLGTHHLTRQAFDSAAWYFQTAIDGMVRSGYDLHTTSPVRLADGTLLTVGAELASRYAKAGLAYRRMGNLVAAVRCYEQMLRYYREQRHEAGIRWGQCLLGEAYEEQSNAVRAATYYEQALKTISTLPPDDLSARAGQTTDLLRYYADLLLTQGQFARLRVLTRQALTMEETLHRREYGHAVLTNLAAELYLLTATAWLHQHHPDSAAVTLAALDRLATPEGQFGLDHLSNWAEWQLTRYCLDARLAHLRGEQSAAQRHLEQGRVLLTTQIREPSHRVRAGEQLAKAMLEVQAYALAARVLHPLVQTTEAGGNRLKSRDFYRLLEEAYSGGGHSDSAYYFARRHRALNDSLRAAQQYAALDELETRHRTAQKEAQLRQVAAQAQQERRQKQWAWLSVTLLAALLAGVVWALRLTRRLNRENRLQAERLAELDQLKTQFFANVSHELRTPLTLVVGPMEQLVQQPAGLSEEARRQLELGLRNGRRLQHLVNSLLDLTKLEAGKLRLNPAPVRLSLFCRQVLDTFEGMAARQQITLQLRDDLPPDLTLALDSARLEQIITNLLANALKFTPPGGWVWLHTKPGDAPSHWRLTVQDTGPGIAPDEQERVFERFYQTRQRRAEGGTGIGLAFSRELAELMGGTLMLESQPGRGSAFTLTLPGIPLVPTATVEHQEAMELEVEALPVVAIAGKDRPRVLVVEDNADLRTYLRQILAPLYEVLEAENGREALALLQHEAVDLICSDEMMPHLSGTELLLRLKAESRWRRVPFLMVTARSDAEHRFRSLELGVDDYLQKPFAPRELLARTHNLLVNYRERLAFAASEEIDVERALTADQTPRQVPSAGQVALAGGLTVADVVVPVEGELRTVADQELLRRVREVAAAAIAEPDFDTLQLVTQVGVSERTLYRKLKELTGLTPAAYLREVRLEHARQLLERRAMQTVAEVAYAVGFDNPGYFATVFLKRYGKRATEYLQ